MTMGEFKDMWSQVDALTKKSGATFNATKADVEAYPGWKFKGCDGIIWRASHQKERVDLSNRSPGDLVADVKRHHDDWAARDAKRADDDAKRKAGGGR